MTTTDPTAPATPGETLDLDVIEAVLAHPLENRPWRDIVRSLVTEVRRLRGVDGMHQVRDADRKLVAKALEQHHATRGVQVSMGVTCECQYWTGSDPLRDAGRPLPWGRDRLDLHRADVVLDALTAAGWHPPHPDQDRAVAQMVVGLMQALGIDENTLTTAKGDDDAG